jgi:hypothetical protein
MKFFVDHLLPGRGTSFQSALVTERKSAGSDSPGAVLKPVRERRDRPAFPPVSGLYYYRSLLITRLNYIFASSAAFAGINTS